MLFQPVAHTIGIPALAPAQLALAFACGDQVLEAEGAARRGFLWTECAAFFTALSELPFALAADGEVTEFVADYFTHGELIRPDWLAVNRIIQKGRQDHYPGGHTTQNHSTYGMNIARQAWSVKY